MRDSGSKTRLTDLVRLRKSKGNMKGSGKKDSNMETAPISGKTANHSRENISII